MKNKVENTITDGSSIVLKGWEFAVLESVEKNIDRAACCTGYQA